VDEILYTIREYQYPKFKGALKPATKPFSKTLQKRLKPLTQKHLLWVADEVGIAEIKQQIFIWAEN
jgi:hypothetical protein